MNILVVLAIGLVSLVLSFALYLVARQLPSPLNVIVFGVSVFFAIGGCLVWVVPALPFTILFVWVFRDKIGQHTAWGFKG